MITDNLITVDALATHHKIEISFFYTINEIGLIEIHFIEQIAYVDQSAISEVEKIIRMYKDLDLNIEGIDIVLNLLHKIEFLQKELISAKNRLRIYE
jgi:hypothetical protein